MFRNTKDRAAKHGETQTCMRDGCHSPGPGAGLLVFDLEGFAGPLSRHCTQSGQDKKVEMFGVGSKQVKREKE